MVALCSVEDVAEQALRSQISRQHFGEMKEALRRLALAEPHKYDERRLMRAHILSMNNEILPKEQRTRWKDEEWCLQKYLNEIEEEKLQRSASTGLEAPYDAFGYQLKQGVTGKGGW